MSLHAALAAAATLVSLAFALCTLERWLDRRKPQEAAWTVALLMYALASASLWAGSALGWAGWSFKAFYVFGAVLNVPILALGTVYLLASRRAADGVAAATALVGAFAAGIVVAAPLLAPVPAEGLPRGADVFGAGPRIAAAVGSGVGATVIIVGALWSAARLALGARRRRAAGAARPTGSTSPGRLAVANVIIAVGALVNSAGGLLNSAMDEMDAFAVSVLAGIVIIFVGFLLTTPPRQPRAVTPWHPPADVVARLATARAAARPASPTASTIATGAPRGADGPHPGDSPAPGPGRPHPEAVPGT